MKKYMKFLIYIITFIIAFFIVNKINSFRSIEKDPVKIQARDETIKYIENKYGFTPEYILTKFEKDNNIFSNPTGNILVRFKYNNKYFYVYVVKYNEEKIFYDNYQFEEISSDIIKYINMKTNIIPDDYTILYGHFNYPRYEGFINEYYTKDNLLEIIKKYNPKIVLEYINKSDLEYIKTNNIFKDLKFDRIIMVNYNSEKMYNKVTTHEYNISGSDSEEYLIENAFYIQSAYVKDIHEEEYYNYWTKSSNSKFYMQEIDGIYYLLEYEDNYVNKEEVTIERITNSQSFSEYLDAKSISNYYGIKENKRINSITLYFPILKYVQFIFYREKKRNIFVGAENYAKNCTYTGNVVGRHFICSIPYDVERGTKFALMYSKK